MDRGSNFAESKFRARFLLLCLFRFVTEDFFNRLYSFPVLPKHRYLNFENANDNDIHMQI